MIIPVLLHDHSKSKWLTPLLHESNYQYQSYPSTYYDEEAIQNKQRCQLPHTYNASNVTLHVLVSYFWKPEVKIQIRQEDMAA